jgi:hypothetical protein
VECSRQRLCHLSTRPWAKETYAVVR